MKKANVDLNKIKEREVSKEEIEKNEKETKNKTWLWYRLPIILVVILSVVYILTGKHILLVPIAIIFVFVLYGIDCHQRICTYCKKWNSTVVIKEENIIRTTKVTKQNLIKKDVTKEKKQILNKTKMKCINCGHIQDIEKIK